MSENPIRLTVPTSRAWARMKNILFHPFDLGKWFVLGFTAWLATLFEGGSSSGGEYEYEGDGDQEIESLDWEGVKVMVGEWIESGRAWVVENPELAMLIGGIFVFVFLLLFVLFWVSCRGKFMFLDNVVSNRALVVQPWKKFRREGNSLFWWGLGFGIFCLVVTVGLLAGGGLYAFSVMETAGWTTESVVTLVGIGGAFLFFLVLFGYIHLLLTHFVVPLMHRYRLSTTDAWRKFLPLHSQDLFRFLLFAIWNALLVIVAVFAIIAVGFGTCCIGFILVALPYIGAVVLLPMTVFFRSLGPEYLAQYGPEWDVFSRN